MDDADEYDFTPTSNSSLASLFNSSLNIETSNLIYTAPKQPKLDKDVRTEASKIESKVMCAHVVLAWRLINGRYESLGRRGLAIIKYQSLDSSEIILYKEKRDVTLRLKINQTLEVLLKKDNFLSFRIGGAEGWLTKFTNEADCKDVIDYITNLGGQIHIVDGTIEEKSANNHETHKKRIPNEITTKSDILSRISKMGHSILPSESQACESIDANISENSVSENSSETDHIMSAPTINPTPQQPQTPNSSVKNPTLANEHPQFYCPDYMTQNTGVKIHLLQILGKLNTIMELVDYNSAINSDQITLKSKVKVLELKVENLSRELASSMEENKKYKEQITDLRSELELAGDHKHLHQQQISEINHLQNQLIADKTNVERLSEQLLQLQQTVQEKDIVIGNVEQKLKQISECNKGQIATEPDEKIANFTSVLKSAMNDLYANITFCIGEVHPSNLNGAIAQSIKVTTLKVIKSFQEIIRDNDTQQAVKTTEDSNM